MEERGLTPGDYDRLRDVVSRRDRDALLLLKTLGERRLTEEERETLRGLVADDLVERGLDDHDEPNAYGLQMERLIDALGYE